MICIFVILYLKALSLTLPYRQSIIWPTLCIWTGTKTLAL